MPFKTCSDCGKPFQPVTHRQASCMAAGCPSHGRIGRIHRSPTTQAQDAEYKAERARVLAGDPDCALQLPGCTTAATTVDHVIPVAKGGGHRGNLVPACAWCNGKKGDRSMPDTAGGRPRPVSRPQPAPPPRLA